MRIKLQKMLKTRVEQYVLDSRNSEFECEKTERRLKSLNDRKCELIKVHAKGQIDRIEEGEKDTKQILYHIHLQYLIKQGEDLYIEEEVERRQATFTAEDEMITDYEINPYSKDSDVPFFMEAMREIHEDVQEERESFHYNRLKAVQYAERWWNSYNPAFKKFDVDCTNFISQCLYAGGAPMRGYPNRGKGWWMRNNNWSYSWTVANSFRWYLPNSKIGLRAKEVSKPNELLLGDVICYDFQGDGRFDHSTIVTARDAYGMPLVNAHTMNSRMRYWSYEDSTAYTPNIKYKFFSIISDQKSGSKA